MFYRHLVRRDTYEPGDTFRGRLPIVECKARVLYRVDTRNLGPIAVFDPECNNGFVGIRRKFGIRLDAEYHWENGAPHGTANPWEELPETLPPTIELVQSMPTVCKHCKVRAKWRSDLSGTHDGPPPGTWYHLAPTKCEDCSPVSYGNEALMTWLKSMEEKYWWPVGEEPEWKHPPVEEDEDDAV